LARGGGTFKNLGEVSKERLSLWSFMRSEEGDWFGYKKKRRAWLKKVS